MITKNDIRVSTEDNNLWITKEAGICFRVKNSISAEELHLFEKHNRDIDDIMKRELLNKIYGEIQDTVNELHNIVMSSVRPETDTRRMDELFQKISEITTGGE